MKLPPCDHDECPPTHCKLAMNPNETASKPPTPLTEAVDRQYDPDTQTQYESWKIMRAHARSLETSLARLQSENERLTKEHGEMQLVLTSNHLGANSPAEVLKAVIDGNRLLGNERDTLRAELAEAKAMEIKRSGTMGRIACTLFSPNDNVTDEHCEIGVKALKLELDNLKKSHETFDAGIVEMLSKVQSGEMTCIYAAQVIENKRDTALATVSTQAALIAELVVEYEGLLNRITKASIACFEGHSQIAEELCHECSGFVSPTLTRAKQPTEPGKEAQS